MKEMEKCSMNNKPTIIPAQPGSKVVFVGNGSCATPWVWGLTLKEAEAQARKRNLRIGISPEEANLIVLSSMMAGEVGK